MINTLNSVFSKMNLPNTDVNALSIKANTPSIKGVPLIADLHISKYHIPHNKDEQAWNDHVKRQLANQIADAIVQKHATFTKLESPDGVVTYKARCFLVDSEDVQVLRTNKVI